MAVSGVLGRGGTPRQPRPCLLISLSVDAGVGVGSPQLHAGRSPCQQQQKGGEGAAPSPHPPHACSEDSGGGAGAARDGSGALAA